MHPSRENFEVTIVAIRKKISSSERLLDSPSGTSQHHRHWNDYQRRDFIRWSKRIEKKREPQCKIGACTQYKHAACTQIGNWFRCIVSTLGSWTQFTSGLGTSHLGLSGIPSQFSFLVPRITELSVITLIICLARHALLMFHANIMSILLSYSVLTALSSLTSYHLLQLW